MKLALIGDDGTILDTSEEFTREEFAHMSKTGAAFLVFGLSPGA